MALSYDTFGNPKTVGKIKSYSWEHGREMMSLSQAIPMAISVQPEDFVGNIGDTATFAVTAVGDNLSYQWEVSKDGGKTWSNATATGNDTASIRMTLSESVAGRLYRCKITNGSLTICSEAAEAIATAITITAQPENYFGQDGETAQFSVTAEGENLSYQWQVSKDGGVA